MDEKKNVQVEESSGWIGKLVLILFLTFFFLNFIMYMLANHLGCC